MTVLQAAEKICGQVVCHGAADIETHEVYAGDFLSRVMGKAPQNSLWLTVMGNVNVAAVAVLAEIKIIVICEGATPDAQLINRLTQEGIALIVTDKSMYDCCRLL